MALYHSMLLAAAMKDQFFVPAINNGFVTLYPDMANLALQYKVACFKTNENPKEYLTDR